MAKNPEDSAMRRTHQAVWAAGVCLAVGAFVMHSLPLALSVFVGALVAALNLIFVSRAVRRVVAGESAFGALVIFVKVLALLAVTYLLVNHSSVDAMGLGLGFAALPLGIFLAGVLFAPAAPPLELDPLGSKAETDHA